MRTRNEKNFYFNLLPITFRVKRRELAVLLLLLYYYSRVPFLFRTVIRFVSRRSPNRIRAGLSLHNDANSHRRHVTSRRSTEKSLSHPCYHRAKVYIPLSINLCVKQREAHRKFVNCPCQLSKDRPSTGSLFRQRLSPL